ncbi:MAG: ketoacyl-ACP synthase III [Phycisphaerales bacterium]
MTSRSDVVPPVLPPIGVEILGTGHHAPDRVVTNHDLAKIMDTSDEWIQQRTGIVERRFCDPTKGETTSWLGTKALEKALEEAAIDPQEIDLLIFATVTGEMTCPATACRVADNVGATPCAAFDLLAACSGFLYALNIAADMIRAMTHRTVAVVGCDAMSRVVDFTNRGVSILFGDCAGAAILRATDDQSRGKIAGEMHADGSSWADLFIPISPLDCPPNQPTGDTQMHSLQMNGREVYKFAVNTFANTITHTLKETGVTPDEVDMFVCHQSNARALETMRKKFGIPDEKLYINIDRYGNCSGGSVPTVFDELRKSGRCKQGDLIMFVAFGGGLTWASTLWRL